MNKKKTTKTIAIIGILLLALSLPITIFFLSTRTFDSNTDAAASNERVIRLPLLAASEKVYAPFSGFYEWRAPITKDSTGKCTGWRSNSNMPLSSDTVDQANIMFYNRIDWADLEKGANQYDFSIIDCFLNDPDSAGKQFGFGVRALSTGDSVYGGKVLRAYPQYLEQANNGVCTDAEKMRTNYKSSTGGVYVPDWNSQCFLKRYKALMDALAKKYDNDPRIGYIENRAYGNYGEWHMSGMNEPASNKITNASLYALVDSVGQAFKKRQVIMLTDNETALIYAMKNYPKMGIKRESLGHPHFINGIDKSAAKAAAIQDRWKTAPYITEYFNSKYQTDPETFFADATDQVIDRHVALVSNANAKAFSGLSAKAKASYETSGEKAGMRYQVDSFTLPTKMNLGDTFVVDTKWTNNGNTPAYTPWNVTFELKDVSNKTVYSYISKANLESVDQFPLGVPVSIADVLAMPRTIAPGVYKLQMSIKDPETYHTPLKLGNTGRNIDGSYPITSITVDASLQGNIPVPTNIPTQSPTKTPTVINTSVPTAVPTQQPTISTSDVKLNINSARLSGQITRKDGYIELNQTEPSNPSRSSKAVFDVNIPETGVYFISAKVSSPSESKNSIYLNFNSDPTALMVWDLPVTKDSSTFVTSNASWRGNDPDGNADIDVAVFTLNKGSNTLVLASREPNVRIKDIIVRRIDESDISTDSEKYDKSFNATSAQKITSPFSKTGTSIIATRDDFDPTKGGIGEYSFNLAEPGLYIVKMKVSAPNTSSNSVFVNIDNAILTESNAWDMDINKSSTVQVVTRRGAGKTEDSSDKQTVFYTLFDGQHTLNLRSREKNTKIDAIYIQRVDLNDSFATGQ